MKSILFFDENITLNVHSASDKKFLGRKSIKDFINEYGPSVRVYELENGELEVQDVSFKYFMTGPEA